jgi:outer membrane protein assembly factor BamD
MFSSAMGHFKKITNSAMIPARSAALVAMIAAALTLGLAACTEKELDPNDPKASFAIAKEPYNDENYEIAITKLGEFKSRFPYSQFATEAELLIANAQFQLARYPEAVVSYEQFAKLHPKHPQADFAMFHVGESYWKDAPEEINREQEFTAKAIEEWHQLLAAHPESTHAGEARKLILAGRKRLADHAVFISDFYCRKEIWHSCAYRYLRVDKDFPEFPEIRRNALNAAADALEHVAKEKEKDPESDKNLFFRDKTRDQILAEAAKARASARDIK